MQPIYTQCMIELTKGKTDDRIVVTLNESSRLNDPFFLFVFTSSMGGESIKWIAGEDESNHPERFNQFTINTAVVFEDIPDGQYHYKVYEQEDDENTDENNSYRLVEQGQMRLRAPEGDTYTEYSVSTDYKAYNG